MEMITSCLTQQLYQAQSSARSKNRSLSFLQSLKEITSSLIDNPTGGKYNMVDQDSEEFAIELFRTSEAKSLMLFLGYIEEEEQFVYNRCDENMSKLADCLKILETEIVHEEVRLNETDLNNDQSNKRSRTGCSSGLRQMFLSRHIQKEHDMTSRKNSAHQSDFSFNTSGYFHQSCSRRDNKRNRGSLREMFHKQDHDTKRLSPSGLNSRLL